MYRTQHPRTMKSIPAFAMSIAVLGATSGCATGPSRNPNDPLESINRATFQFNEVVDRNIAMPIAKRYNAVVPDPVRTMVYHFFSNVGDVAVMANNFAQARVADGLSDLMRIAVNSVFGLAGLIDIASPAGLPKHDQDFGLTLGHWGLPMGPYLVLPLFGPSTFRDTAGFAGDWQVDPVIYLGPAERNSLFAVNFVSTRARYLGVTDLLSTAALDKYSFTRDAYLGRRRYQLTGGEEEALPNYESEAAPAGTPADKGTDDKNKDSTVTSPADGAARPTGNEPAELPPEPAPGKGTGR
jgi:phospholipid-binding lipoprotein MlaA